MRKAFVLALVELARKDPKILLLTADLGYLTVEPFVEEFPDRFFNVGVSEQNMLGLATGLAESGYLPFLYSIIPFAILRPYEALRNGPVMHALPVRIAGVGAGMDYSTNGATHYGLEDVGALRLQPGMNIICPADFEQTTTALNATYNMPGPVYYRLGRDDVNRVPGLNGRFDVGRLNVVRDGADILLLAMGNAALEACGAADILQSQGVSATVAVVASVSPPPISDLAKMLGKFPLAVTAETHYVTGGLGSLVCEVVAGHGIACRVVRCGIDRLPDGRTGGQQFMNDRYGISAAKIAERASNELSAGRREITSAL
ncbi:MAG: transketolase C-terminal domain-containing protein [Capsulimonadaceae bacterium]|nr:transketolase C-terminal domain-containing protein [Capsulimonadaceae bacterium]